MSRSISHSCLAGAKELARLCPSVTTLWFLYRLHKVIFDHLLNLDVLLLCV